jgi:signal transduction histidine kinase
VTLLALLAAASLAWALLLQRRLARAADLEHEVRGALTTVGLAVERCSDPRLARALTTSLARARAALDGRVAERCTLESLVRSSVVACDPASPHAGNEGDLGHLGRATVAAGPGATVLGNLVANAMEHGDGPLSVRIEVANDRRERSVETYPAHSRDKSPLKRGRGLRIAARAARAAGGRLDVRDDGGRFAAVVELPVER